MSRINKRYSKDLKLKVVKKYLEEKKAVEELLLEFNISSKTQIYSWIKKYQENGEETFDLETRGNPKRKISYEEIVFDNLEEEVRFLRMENEYYRKFCEILKKNLKEKN